METQLPLPQRSAAPQFLAHICCGQIDGWIKTPLGREVGLGPSNTVLDGDPAPPPKKWGRAPEFSAHVCCSATACFIKMQLGMEIGLGPGHIVLDGDPAPLKRAQPLPPKKGGTASHPSIFGPCLLWSNGWMDQYVTWYGGRL